MNKEILLAGGRFCMVGELWVDKDMLDLPFPENFDLDNAQAHYQDLDTWACGTIAKLYWDLKPHLQSYLADAELRPSFKEHVSVNLLLCRCPQLISLPVCIVHGPAQSRTQKCDASGMYTCCSDTGPQCQYFQFWGPHKWTMAMRAPQEPIIFVSVSPHFAPPISKFQHFCYRAFQIQGACKGLDYFSILYFKHQSFNCLDQFIKLVLFGAKSLTSASSKMCPMKGILWGVEKTTPGMITVAVTLVSICSAYFLLCWPFNIGVS